jgi:hypothetical protein
MPELKDLVSSTSLSAESQCTQRILENIRSNKRVKIKIKFKSHKTKRKPIVK